MVLPAVEECSEKSENVGSRIDIFEFSLSRWGASDIENVL